MSEVVLTVLLFFTGQGPLQMTKIPEHISIVLGVV
jgi:hypothetical protein